jgi:hypothetical protein
MAWTAPRTWVAGETHTAAQHNTHVRDNVLYLYESRRAGAVSSAGAVTNGSLFSSVKDSTGQYTVTFSASFAGQPAVTVTPITGSSILSPIITAVSAAAFTVQFRNSSSTLSDTAFNFIAVLIV